MKGRKGIKTKNQKDEGGTLFFFFWVEECGTVKHDNPVSNSKSPAKEPWY